ncbi:hypothetical protein DSM25558_2210 [Agrobacterium sp. DSM 25558]|nr:hypothetical protein DSM25558_2210 [Agrobacterium sp. DSM 25558]
MSQSKAREDAELACSDMQSQFLGRGNAVEEIDHVARSREEKKRAACVKRGLQRGRRPFDSDHQERSQNAQKGLTHGQRPQTRSLRLVLRRALQGFAAGVALWIWEVGTDELVMDSHSYMLCDVTRTEPLTVERLR